MKVKDIDYLLYLVTDSDICGRNRLFDYVEQAILGGVTIVQLREKSLNGKQFYETALKLKEITKYYNVPLIINDRVDIALAADADGVHLGQNDLPCQAARKILGEDKIIGVSAKTVEMALVAEKDGADYLGVGAAFHTSTKTDTTAVSKDIITAIKQSVKIPVVAIGGINLNNAAMLNGCGIDGTAVVSAIMGSEFPRKSAEELIKIIKNL